MRAGFARNELGYTVAGSLLGRLLRDLREQGVAPEPILSVVGVTQETLEDPAARIARAAYHQAFELAATLTNQADYGLLCGERASLDAFHVVGYVLAGQPSVVDVLERLSALHRLLDDASADSIERDGERVTLITQEPSRSAARPRQAAEFAVASFVTLLLAHTAGKCVVRRIGFMHPRPASVLQHVRLFKTVPEFGCDHIVVELDGASVTLSPPGAAPGPSAHHGASSLSGHHGASGLIGHLERYARERLAEMPSDDFVVRVERAVLARLSAGPPTVEHTAKALGMSTRTLQRRLKEVGENFVGVVDRVRRDVVRHALESADVKLDSIAAAVGFTDVRSLRRAARRWFGSSASAVRSERRQGRG